MQPQHVLAPAHEKKPSIEEMFTQILQNQAASIKNLEVQVGQIASALNQ